MFKVADLYKKEYYVYEHIVNGKVFYIGKGCGARAVDFINRSNQWKEFAKGRLNEIDINIVAHFDKDSEAKIYEISHIKNMTLAGHKLTNVNHNNKKKTYQYKRKIYTTSHNHKSYELSKIYLDSKVLNEYIDMCLTVKDKEELCMKLNLRDRYGRLRKWRAIKSVLENNGYKIKNSKITIDGKRTNVSTITIEKR